MMKLTPEILSTLGITDEAQVTQVLTLADEHAIEILSPDESRLLEAAAEPAKTLEQQAADAGMVVLDRAALTALEQDSQRVTQLEAVVEQLNEDAATSRRELSDTRFDVAFEDAERVGKAAPAQRDDMRDYYEQNPEAALKMLENAPPIVNVQPRGANVKPAGDDVPANTHAEHYELNSRVHSYMQEHGTDYVAALEALTGVGGAVER
jgi:G3E family GTPase